MTFLKGYDTYRKELNIFQILQTVHKLKATVQILLDEDRDKLMDIKKLYFHYSNIHHDIDRSNLNLEHSDVRKFLDRDEKKLLYRHLNSSKHNKQKLDPQLLSLGIMGSTTVGA